MQIYLGAVFNHFRALQGWAADKSASVTLDVKTFEVEVKHRGRYYVMQPLFQARAEGRLVHIDVLPEQVIAFGGWRPYRPLSHPLSTDKLQFKQFLRDAGLRTPAFVEADTPDAVPPFDYLIKGAAGSFGREIAGPFSAGVPIDVRRKKPGQHSERTFAEQFVLGRAVKVWFWGQQPFFAHAHAFPSLTGDGGSSVDELLTTRLQRCKMDWPTYADREVVLDCLHFQGVSPSDVLPQGRTVWFDYRYSLHYEPIAGHTVQSDNALPHLLQHTGEQVPRLGEALAAMLQRSFPAPILVTADGILDAEGRIWWLEMNTNSVMPPEGYAVMFADLFG